MNVLLALSPAGKILRGSAELTWLYVIVQILHPLLFWACAIYFCQWMFRAYQNVSRMSPDSKFASPSTIVWSWFVPIWNLWAPYMYCLQIWRASDPRDDLPSTKRSVPVEFPLWWLTWLLSGWVGSMSVAWLVTLTRNYELFWLVRTIPPLFGATSALFAARIVHVLTQRQTHKVHLIAAREDEELS
jgi:hypothetical protein